MAGSKSIKRIHIEKAAHLVRGWPMCNGMTINFLFCNFFLFFSRLVLIKHELLDQRELDQRRKRRNTFMLKYLAWYFLKKHVKSVIWPCTCSQSLKNRTLVFIARVLQIICLVYFSSHTNTPARTGSDKGIYLLVINLEVVPSFNSKYKIVLAMLQMRQVNLKIIKWKSAQSFKKDLTRQAIFLWACIQLWISLEQSFHFTGSHSMHTRALKFNECILFRRFWQSLRYISKCNDVNQKRKKEVQEVSFIIMFILIVSQLLCFEFWSCSLLWTKYNHKKGSILITIISIIRKIIDLIVQ